MKFQAQKIELIQMLLNTTKPNIIKKIKAIFEEANVNTIENSSMTIAQLEKEIEEAEADIKAGRIYTTAQLKAHFKK